MSDTDNPPFDIQGHYGPTEIEDSHLMMVVLCAQHIRAKKRKRQDDERRAESYDKGILNAFFRDMFLTKFESLDANTFRAMFRMSRYAFEILYEGVSPFLQHHVHPANAKARQLSNRRPVSVDEKICVGLRILAGASYVDAIWGFSIQKTTVYYIFWEFVVAVLCSDIGKIECPETAEEMQACADLMTDNGNKNVYYHGCFLVLDGYAVRIRAPTNKDVPNPASYKNRKSFWSINLQAMTDGVQKFRWLDMTTPGSTHDSTAFFSTKTGRSLAGLGAEESGNHLSLGVLQSLDNFELQAGENLLPDGRKLMCNRSGRPFWVSTDEAYGAFLQLVSPWPGQGLLARAPHKDAFNYLLSNGSRNGVERAFGHLYARWGILWRPIQFKFEKIPKIVMACCRLHNFLIDIRDLEKPILGSGLGYFGSRVNRRGDSEQLRQPLGQSGYDDTIHNQRDCHLEIEVEERMILGRGHQSCPIRQQITNSLTQAQITRPRDSSGRLAGILYN
jgi:hypothetical protein